MLATPAVLNTANADHPYRKAKKSPYICLKKMYCPPVSGNMAATSALLIAPNSVMIPAPIQTAINISGEPTCDAMVAGFMKIPEPIRQPTTIDIAALRPNEVGKLLLVKTLMVSAIQ